VDRASGNLRILWGSPLPPVRSGVADYAVELLPELARLAEVRVLEPPGWRRNESWPSQLVSVPTDTARSDGEVEILHLGNNPHHLWLLPRLRAGGAVVVLHDAVLHHLLVEFLASHGDMAELETEIAAAHGIDAASVARAREVGHHGHMDPFLLPVRQAFLRHARAVAVHSRWTEKLVRDELPETPLGRLELAAADPAPIDRGSVRARLEIDDDEVVLMHLGFLTPEKGLEEILSGLLAAVRAGTNARLVVVGEGELGPQLLAAADRAGVRDRLTVTGWIEPRLFRSVPAAADLGVVYRFPSAGETSSAALRFLACGVPVAVGGRRQFLEWPEDAAPRLTPGPAAAADLARLVSRIGGEGWAARRRAARAVYEASHRPADVALGMVDFIRGLPPV
jgi:glycosyltransferase involved in cell wall biosynthesis